MDEKKFWSMIETAWEAVGGRQKVRQKLAAGSLSEDAADVLAESVDEVVESLRGQLGDLSRDDLLEFDRILERKLYDIDRADIQKHTEGSDDGFLYARGFVVLAGKGYYEAVKARPSIAMADLECEDLCYLSSRVFEEKFGEVPDSGISRESCSNKAGWPGLK